MTPGTHPGNLSVAASEQSDTPESTRLTAESFAARFQDSWRILWCAAVGVVRDRNQAQDIVQQAAIVGLQNLDDFDARTNFVSWMARIVKNIALNEARKSMRRRTSAIDSSALDAHADPLAATPRRTVSANGSVLPDQDAFDDTVLAALDELDDTARSCLLMRVVLDLPYAQIARVLDIPEGTAASHVHRARGLVRDRLADSRPALSNNRTKGGRP